MTYPILFAIFLVTATVPTSFAQTIADIARAERARREAAPSMAILVDSDGAPLGREALLEEALRVSGARKQLEQVLEAALESAAIRKQPEAISKQDYQEIITEAFDPNRLIRMMEKSVGEAVSDRAVKDVVLWYRSSLGQKVSRAELSAGTAGTSTEMQDFAATLQENPLSANRMRLAQQWESQTQATAKTVHMLFSIVMSVYKGMTASGVGVPPPPPDFEKTFRAQMTAPLREALTLWFLFTFRSISDNEIAGYQTFLKSPSATAFNDAVWNAMNASFVDAGQQLGRKIAENKPPA